MSTQTDEDAPEAGQLQRDVMARVRSEEPPDETGQYWLEEHNEKLDMRRAPEMKRVFYVAGKLRIKPGPGHGKPVDEVDGVWTGPMPDPKQISERREAP